MAGSAYLILSTVAIHLVVARSTGFWTLNLIDRALVSARMCQYNACARLTLLRLWPSSNRASGYLAVSIALPHSFVLGLPCSRPRSGHGLPRVPPVPL